MLTEVLVAVSVNFSIANEGWFFPLHQEHQTTCIRVRVGEDADEMRRTELLPGNDGLFLSVL